MERRAGVAKVGRLLVVVVGPLLVALHAVATPETVRVVERCRRAAQLRCLRISRRGALEIDLGRRPADGAVVGFQQTGLRQADEERGLGVALRPSEQRVP